MDSIERIAAALERIADAIERAVGPTEYLPQRNGRPELVLQMIEQVIRERGPMKRGALADELEENGLELPGHNKEARSRYIGTILWRARNKFESTKDGYQLIPAAQTASVRSDEK